MTSKQFPLRFLLCSLSIALGLVPAICGDSFQGDGVSYLDMGDHFFAGDRAAILNGLWSPLFPFIHGLARWLLKPTMRWEPAVLQLTNFLVYASTVLAFQFFWAQVLRFYRFSSESQSQPASTSFSDEEFWILGYAIFLFMQLDLVTFMNPDMLLAAIVFLSSGMILKIRLSGATLLRFSLLGVLLGIGFLTKALMLPLAVVFLAAVLLPSLRQRAAAVYALAAAIAFGAIAGPYIYELSRKEGHFTAGDAAKLNYAWHVNGAPITHWHGEIAGLGKPEHPTREIFSSPLIYEFGTPVGGTFSPWYDPSYWNAGLRPRFNVGDQLHALEMNLRQYLRAFWSQNALIACVLILIALRRDKSSIVHDFLGAWYLWLPAVSAFGLYGMVWVEHRYVSQFFVLFWAAALTLVRVQGQSEARLMIRIVTIVAVLMLTIRTGIVLIKGCANGHRAAVSAMNIAENLFVQGVRPSEKVALIPGDLGDGWQKLARMIVVAEIPLEDQGTFWATDEVKRHEVYRVLASTGATVVIAPEVPSWAQTAGWERVGSTPVYFYRLTP